MWKINKYMSSANHMVIYNGDKSLCLGCKIPISIKHTLKSDPLLNLSVFLNNYNEKAISQKRTREILEDLANEK